MDRASQLLHERRRASGPALQTGLQVLLWALGYGLVLASRFSAPIRSQITRNITVEISTDDGIARHWVFDGQRRRASVSIGRAEAPDFAVRFTSSGQALRSLTSPRAVERIMSGWIRGTVRLEGSPLILLWFDGLLRKMLPMRPQGAVRQALPGAYLAHDPASNGVERVIIEPTVRQLDPRWTAAWNARAKLWIVRGASGDPLLREP
jgi:hypothetical protein